MEGLVYDILETGIALFIVFGPFIGLLPPRRPSWKVEPPHLLEVEIMPAFENDWRRLIQLLVPLAQETGTLIEEQEQKILLRAVSELQIEAVAEKLRCKHEAEFTLGEPDVFYRCHLWNDSIMLWEPVMKVKVFTPEAFVDGIERDLRNRRSSIINAVWRDRGKFLVTAFVPLEEMFGYTKALESLSDGEAAYTIAFDHFLRLPPDDPEPKQPAVIAR
jgi:translation elongation factor EF-G